LFNHCLIDGMNGDDTRERLLRAAQCLFAEGGEEATSLRAITREAEANVAAVHYHFGGRDGLLREVLNRHIEPINVRRLEILDNAIASTAEPPLAVLIEAFVRPDLETLAQLRETEPQIARFIGRAYSQPSAAVAAAAAEQFAGTANRFLQLFAARLPGLSEAELATRIDLVVTIITGLFARARPSGDSPPLGVEELDKQVALLVSFVAGALAAPPAK